MIAKGSKMWAKWRNRGALLFILFFLSVFPANAEDHSLPDGFWNRFSRLQTVLRQLPKIAFPETTAVYGQLNRPDVFFPFSGVYPRRDYLAYRFQPWSPSSDFVIGWSDPNEVKSIHGSYSHDGNIIIVNNGRLVLDSADFRLRGNIIILHNGSLVVRNSHLQILSQYIYQHAIVALDQATVLFDGARVSVNGRNWNASFTGQTRVTIRDTHFDDGITAALFNRAYVRIERSNPLEWILFDSVRVEVFRSHSHIFWFVFGDSSKAVLSFPRGQDIFHYSLSAEQPDVQGIGYTFQLDSTSSVYWGVILQEGSDVTVTDSYLRAAGIQILSGDTLEISGLVNGQYYEDFLAPISDRRFRLVRTKLETWNVYPWGAKYVELKNNIIGELGAAKDSRITLAGCLVDGSGGYVFTEDSTFSTFFLSSIFSHVIARDRSTQLHVYSSSLAGDVLATDASIMLLVHSETQQVPVAKDTALIVEMAVLPPKEARINALLPVYGSAAVWAGPYMPLALHHYRLDVGPGSDPSVWKTVAVSYGRGVRRGELAVWDTRGLEPGLYTLRLVLFLTPEDSLEAKRQVVLGPDVGTGLGEESGSLPRRFRLLPGYPNPFSEKTAIRFFLPVSMRISLRAYDLLGREVAVLAEGNFPAGAHQVPFHAERLPQGVYLIRLEGDGISAQVKVLHLNRQ
jgi:hypothetical protein